MKIYHLTVKESGEGMEINTSPDGEDKFSSFEILGILEIVKAQIIRSMGNPQPVVPLIIPKGSMN